MSTSPDNALEMTRISLLEQIQACESHPNTSTTSQDLLKCRYNETIEQIIDQKVGILPDPIDILPPEIWICILQHLIASINSKLVERALNLTLVSEKWRDSLITYPELWSQISVGPGLAQPDLLATLATGLYLSQEYPLTVDIVHPTRDWDLVIPVLRPHVHRIRHLSIRRLKTRNHGPVDSNNPSASEILCSFGQLPQLVGLDLYRPRDSNYSADFYGLYDFISRNNSIKSITGAWMTPQILEQDNLKQIKDIALKFRLGQLLPWISRHPDLRSLHHFSGSRSGEEEELILSISETRLGLLWLYSPIASCAISLIKSSPHLIELKILVSWSKMVDFMNILDFLPLLNHLSIELSSHSSQIDAFEALIIPPVTKVRILRITHDYSSYTEERLRLERSNTMRLYDALKDCMPVVEDLMLSASREFDIPYTYLASLSRLASLRLRLSLVSEEDIPELRLSSISLLELKISPEVVQKLISSIICDRLVDLRIQEPISSGKFAETHPIELDPITFQSLSKLRWGSDVLGWIPTSMASLRVVSFMESSRTTPSDFCVYLIKRPHDCPALDEIKFRDWPEWDLLFTMLERRNFLIDSNVSPIKFLTFPSTMAPFLFHALTNLLKCRFTIRPQNEELQLLGIEWDSGLCYNCWKSMQRCNSDPSEYYRMKYTTRRECSEYVESLPYYPPISSGVQDWLEKRQKRYDELHGREADWMRETRGSTCSKHELGEKYTTKGVIIGSFLKNIRYL